MNNELNNLSNNDNNSNENNSLTPNTMNNIEANENNSNINTATSEESIVQTQEFDKTSYDLSSPKFIEKERKVWPFVLIIIILLLGGLFAYYYFVLTNPNNVINKIFNNMYTSAEKITNSNSSNGNVEIDSYIFDSNITITSNNEKWEAFSGMNAKLYFGYDLKDNNKNKTDINILLKENELLNFAMSTIDNKTYFDYKNIFPKVVYVENEAEPNITSSNRIDKTEINKKASDTLYVLKILKDNLIKNISEEKLNKKIILKDIDGKKTPVVEIKYLVDYKEYKKIYISLCDAIINDNRALETIGSYFNKTSNQIKDKLLYKKDNINELDFGDNKSVIIDVDALTNKLVNIEVEDNNSLFKLRDSNTETNVNISYKYLKSIDVTIDKNENKIFVDAKIGEDENVTRISFTVKFNIKESNQISFDSSLVIYDTKDINKESLSLANKSNILLNKEVNTLDVVDAVNISELPADELERFNKLQVSSLNELSKIFSSLKKWNKN